jgi:hypothetical protein
MQRNVLPYRRVQELRFQKGASDGGGAAKNKKFQGRTYWVNASPLYDSDGTAVGTVEVFRDITEHARQQDALRQQNKRLLREANLAARMQRDLFLAQVSRIAHVKVASRYLPASSLGGDMLAASGRATASRLLCGGCFRSWYGGSDDHAAGWRMYCAVCRRIPPCKYSIVRAGRFVDGA